MINKGKEEITLSAIGIQAGSLDVLTTKTRKHIIGNKLQKVFHAYTL